MTWIDYKKAFNRIHDKVLNICRVIITLLKYNVERWHTNSSLMHEKYMAVILFLEKI